MSVLDGLLRYEETKIRELARDEQLFTEGQPTVAIYEVKRGSVQLRRHTIDGRTVVVYTAKAGGLIAEAALFAPRYHCSAVATVASTVRGYPKAAVLSALRRDPKKMESFLANFARQIQGLRFQLEIRNTRSAEARLLQYLELRADPSSRCIMLNGPLQDIATEVGLTREALYRAVASLVARGVLRRGPEMLQLR
ncbi:MAG TPA: Crp/Fnr family transcriptional regulator [Rhizomicrobium sp.]|nr:Crp/Fnr family transcriptional regulator [Rhizomicrobium sp.]